MRGHPPFESQFARVSCTPVVPPIKSVSLVTPSGSVRVGWFPGASREAVADAIRAAAHLPASAAFHLETSDGVVVALDDSIPDGTELRLVTGAMVTGGIVPVPGPKSHLVVGNLPELRNPEGEKYEREHRYLQDVWAASQ